MTVTIYCDPVLGSDGNNGLTPETAVASPTAANNRQKALVASSTAGARVLFRRGRTHNFTSTFFNQAIHNLPDNQALEYDAYGEGPDPRIVARTQLTGFVVVPGLTSTVRAAYTGTGHDLWTDGGLELKRATLGGTNDAYRIHQWEPSTKSVLVHNALVPATSGLAGLTMAISIGWNQSYLPVSSIEDGPAPYKRIFFAEPAASIEFEKGTITSDPLAFARGPYHVDGQRFWWEGRIEFATTPGEWVRWGDFIYVRLPAGMSPASFEAPGVYVPNGINRLFSNSGGASLTDYTQITRNIRWNNLLFKHIGFPRINKDTDGWVGYHSAQGLFDNNGVTATRMIDGALYFFKAQGMAVINCRFQEMSALAVRGISGLSDFVFDGCAFWKLDASAMFINGAVGAGTSGSFSWTSLYDQPEETQNRRIIFKDCLAVDIARYYMGVCWHVGPWKDLKASHFKIRGCTNGAITPAIGARWYEMWNTNNEISHFDIKNVMTITTDGGAIYTSGNMSGRMSETLARLHSLVYGPAFKVHSGKIKGVYKSGYDPIGGTSNMVYADLGARSNVYFGIFFEDGEVMLNHNGAQQCSIKDCRVVNVSPWADIRARHSANQVFPRGSNDGIRTWPPLNSPANATDLEKWNGTGAFAGTFPFKDAFRFPNADAVVNPVPHPSGSTPHYNHLSRIVNCGPSVPWNVPDIGPRQEIRDRYADILAEAA